MKKIIRNLITAVVATTLCLTGCGSAGTADKSTDSTKSTEKSAQESTQTASGSAIQGKLSGKHHAKITVKDYGTIEVELDADKPRHGDKFCQTCSGRILRWLDISPHHLRLYDSGRRPGRHRNGRIG